jgi:sialidase-1
VAGAPEDYLLCYGLETLLVIGAAAFQPAGVALTTSELTVCFWLQAHTSRDTQVIVNCGHRHADEPGWSCFLHGGHLVASVCNAQGTHAAIACAYPTDERWHHVTAIIGLEQATISAALDGGTGGWHPSTISLHPSAPAGGHAGLIVGGYTDAAGGHFSYTFGRNGAGFVDDLRVYPRALTADEISGFAPPPHPAPVARFTWQAPGSEAPVRVRFTAVTSDESDESGAAYLWSWPDGQRSLGHTVERDFDYAGDHAVRLAVIDEHHVQVTAEAVITLGGVENPLQVTPVFVNGEGGYAAFRIPSIVRAANGDLVAFAEGRVESASDSTATIRIVSKSSSDDGRTWRDLRVVARNEVDGVERAAMNASPVVDTVRGTGRIILVFKKLEHSEWEIAQGRGVMRTCCLFSDDHGRSWHGERDITGQVHRPCQPSYGSVCPAAARPENREHDWRIQVPTLGHALQLRGRTANGETNPATRGRLFHVGSRTRNGDSVFASMNYAFWSDDLGESWQIGDFIATRGDGSPARGLNEATAVELADGRVLVNSRNYQDEQPVGVRAATVGAFDARSQLTFGPAHDDPALIEPAVQASLLRLTWPDQPGAGGRSRILFANPAHASARVNMTVRMSYDEGATWPVAKVVDPGPSAYSDLVVQTDGGIGLLYERGNAGGIVYARFTLAWLTDGRDALESAEAALDGEHRAKIGPMVV